MRKLELRAIIDLRGMFHLQKYCIASRTFVLYDVLSLGEFSYKRIYASFRLTGMVCTVLYCISKLICFFGLVPSHSHHVAGRMEGLQPEVQVPET